MFCSKCGQPNDDSAQFCSSCGNMLNGNYNHLQQVAESYVCRTDPASQRPVSMKSKGVFAVLALLLGCFGGHWFYLNHTKKAVIMLIIGFFGLFLFFPLIVTGLWSFVDFIMVLSMSDAEFNEKYNSVV